MTAVNRHRVVLAVGGALDRLRRRFELGVDYPRPTFDVEGRYSELRNIQ